MSVTFNWCIDKTKIAACDNHVFCIDEYGTKHWYLNGELHREGGPALECANGTKHWHLNGKCHRENGPAFEYADGTKVWWLNGKIYSESKYWKEMNK